MLRLEESLYIDVNHVESLKMDSSVFIVRMISGDQIIVSPSNFQTILTLKKYVDDVTNPMAY